MKKQPSVNYKKLYKKEVDKSNTFYNLAESRGSYANELIRDKAYLAKENEELKKEHIRLMYWSKRLEQRNSILEKDIDSLEKCIQKANAMHIDLYNQYKELSIKHNELIKINHLLQDTISSYQTPGYKKLWASIKYQVKTWTRGNK